MSVGKPRPRRNRTKTLVAPRHYSEVVERSSGETGARFPAIANLGTVPTCHGRRHLHAGWKRRVLAACVYKCG